MSVTSPAPLFNVMDFGATGNGITNDSTAITNAIAAASAVGGGIVFFPAGTYALNHFTLSNNNIRLIGTGNADTTLLQADTTSPFIEVTASNISFENITVSANSAVQSGIFLANSISNIAFYRTKVTGAGSYGVRSAGVSNLKVDLSEFSGNGSDQFLYDLPAGTTARGLYFRNSLFDGSGVSTPFTSLYIITDPASNGGLSEIVVVGCTFRTLNLATETDGLVIDTEITTTGNTSDISVTGNVFEALGAPAQASHGFEVKSATNVAITGNSFSGFYASLLLELNGGPNPNGAVSGNTINMPTSSNSSGTGISVFAGSWAITGNFIYGGATNCYAISINDAQNVIVGNSIMSTASFGVQLKEGDCIVSGNVISVTSSGSSEGIILQSGASNCQVRNNHIMGAYYAIVMNGTTYSNLAISGNTFSGVTVDYHGGTSGFTITDDSNGVQITTNVPVTLGAALTVATLPAASAALQGARTYVTDAMSPTFLGALTGGGSVVCLVFCNGTAWVAG